MSNVTSTNKSPSQTGLTSPQRGPLYASLDADSGPSTTQISSLSESVPVAPKISIFSSHLERRSVLDEEPLASTCLNPDSSDRDLNKTLPTPPSRIHSVRHSVMTLWYRRLKKLEGYHFGVLCCAVTTAMVLVINLILTIWAVSSSGVQNGLGTLQDGSCKRTTTLTFWAHLAINVLSTLLLGASNYSMQCLSSPTRTEIDKAHGKGIWLDIGVPSVRNLRHLSMARVALWWLLAISSIPLHLLYNSTVFSTLCTNDYTMYLVSSEFLNGAPFNGESSGDPFKSLEGYQKNQTSLERLDAKTCVEVYTAQIMSSHSDVLLVSTYSNFTNSLLGNQEGGFYADNYLECPKVSGCYLNIANLYLTDPQDWLRYCLSVPAKEHCKLQFSLTIMIVVIVCNLIKTVCMSTIAWKQDPEPLVTLGDAIASFMDRPDVTTEGNCIAEKARFEKSKSWDSLSGNWDSKSLLLFRAASSRRWIVCNIL